MNLTMTRDGELRLGVNDTDPMYMRLELPPDGREECRDCIYVSSEDRKYITEHILNIRHI